MVSEVILRQANLSTTLWPAGILSNLKSIRWIESMDGKWGRVDLLAVFARIRTGLGSAISIIMLLDWCGVITVKRNFKRSSFLQVGIDLECFRHVVPVDSQRI